MGILSNLFSGGAEKLVSSVGGVLDNLITSKEEKEAAKLAIEQEINRHSETQEAEITKRMEAELKDTQSARDSNVKIQESDKASKLAKNVAYILDLIFVTSFLFMLGIILYKSVPEDNKELFYTGFGLLGGYVGTIINFHRGTSSGSANKAAQIEKMVAKM